MSAPKSPLEDFKEYLLKREADAFRDGFLFGLVVGLFTMLVGITLKGWLS